MQAFAYFAAQGKTPARDSEAYLRRLFETLKAPTGHFVWQSWQEAVALLGFKTLEPLVRAPFGKS